VNISDEMSGMRDMSLRFYRSEHGLIPRNRIDPDRRRFGDGTDRRALFERLEIIFSVSTDWKKENLREMT
jgi:hypothetical protein